jgi:hypothetical protein
LAVDGRARVRWDAAVPKYDAFGREIGDDPLKSLRENTNAAPAEAARVEVSTREPEIEPEVPEAGTTAWSGSHEPQAAAEPVFVPPQISLRRRRRGFGLAGLLVLIAGLGAIGLVANSAVEEGQDIIDRFEATLPDADAEPDAPPPVGLEADSLIRENNFASAMQTLADSGLGRPTMLRIAPERIDAQLLDGNTMHIVQVTPDGELREFGTSQGTGEAMAYKAIDTSAPERLVRRGSTAKSPPRNINYLVMSPGPPLFLGAYFKSGRIVIGDAHGKPQRVL